MVGATDTTPPVTTPAPSPEPNHAGWNGGDVTVRLKAVDDAGGSGVKELTYSAEGAQPIAVTTTATGSADIAISAEGVTTITFFATDNAGNVEPVQTITVRIDKTPPTIACSASPNRLWPPNGRMVEINVTVAVSDKGAGAAGFVLTSVTSSEPNGANDIHGFDVGTADTTGQLRAKREGSGPGRVYTLRYAGNDVAGNVATCRALVTVPHSQ